MVTDEKTVNAVKKIFRVDPPQKQYKITIVLGRGANAITSRSKKSNEFNKCNKFNK